MTANTPIFVLGPGRCGTSTVARILHEKCGVSMGRWLTPTDANNPNGYYEDMGFKTFNEYAVTGRMNMTSWSSTVRALTGQRIKAGVPWGIKDPRMCGLMIEYLIMCPDAVLVRCQRPMRDVAKSMCRCYGWKDAEEEVHKRERMLDGATKGRNVHWIDFAKQRADSELERELKEICDGED